LKCGGESGRRSAFDGVWRLIFRSKGKGFDLLGIKSKEGAGTPVFRGEVNFIKEGLWENVDGVFDIICKVDIFFFSFAEENFNSLFCGRRWGSSLRLS
jgi:hypothetical protein